MNTLLAALVWIGNGILVPCIALLLYFMLRMLVMAGQEWQLFSSSKKVSKRFDISHVLLLRHDYNGFVQSLKVLETTGYGLVSSLRKLCEADTTCLSSERELGKQSLQAEDELLLPRLFIRVGPALGLIGTLIPMGPALAGLAAGDLQSLATNMQVAFGTTVLGVLIGGGGYCLYLARKQRLALDFHQLEFVHECRFAGIQS